MVINMTHQIKKIMLNKIQVYCIVFFLSNKCVYLNKDCNFAMLYYCCTYYLLVFYSVHLLLLVHNYHTKCKNC